MKKKLTGKKRSLLLVALIGTFLLGALFYIRTANRSLDTTQLEREKITSQLEMIEYSLEPVKPNKINVRSSNYDFELTFPNRFEFSTGKNITKYAPQNESVDLGARDKEETDDLLFTVSVHLANNRDLELFTQELIDSLKRNAKATGDIQEIKDSDIKLKKSEILVNGVKGIKLESRDAFDFDIQNYIFQRGDKFFEITAMRDHNKYFTSGQLIEIRDTANSFKFLD